MSSAFLFGLMHLFNPHSGAVPAIAIALETSVLLAAAYVARRRRGRILAPAWTREAAPVS